MAVCLRITSLLRFWGAAALVIALYSAQPSDVFASCGDWLAGHAPAEPDHAASDAGEQVAGESADHDPPAVPIDSSNPRPCPGPGCRRAPEAPAPSAPPSTLSDGQDRWFTLAAEPLALSAGLRRLVSGEAHDLPVGFRPRVDRPPRV